MNGDMRNGDARNSGTALRLSPIHDSLQLLGGTWREINGMPTLVSIPSTNSSVAIADLSCFTRFGVKGPSAAEWLAQQGVPIPTHPNTWCPLSNDGIIARLGMTEFLLEAGIPGFDFPFTGGEVDAQSSPFEGGFRGISDSSIITRLTQAAQDPPPQVYPVLRQDLAIALSGSAINDLLLQTCSFNFRALSLADHPVVLTSMIGVTVTVIPSDRDGIPFYRLWCDSTFGVCFWETLLAIVQELGGGAIGVENLFGVR